MKTIAHARIARRVSLLLLEARCVSISTEWPFRFASGIVSPLYTDNRWLLSHPDTWRKIISSMTDLIRQAIGLKNVDVLSGTATAAIPHTALLAYRLKLPMIYVRSSKKDHGKESEIEGRLIKGQKVLIVEDLVSTGCSLARNVTAVRGAGGVVTDCVAITTSTIDAFGSTIRNLGIRLSTLTDVATTLDIAQRNRYITGKQKSTVASFLTDPLGWGRKMGFES